MTSETEDKRLKRRGFLRGLGALVAVLAGASLVFREKLFGFRLGRRKPNIILMVADDLGYGELGSYGQEVIQTPALDALAAESVRFTQFYAGSPVCSPSRCSLMTGLHTGHTRIRLNKNSAGELIPLRPEDFTVAELLQSAGYVTGIFGKWDLGEPGTAATPEKKGFDVWFGHDSSIDLHYPEYVWRNEEKVPIAENANGRHGVYAQDLYTQEAMNFIRDNKDNRFFLYFPLALPHAPLQVPDDELYAREPWPEKEKIYAAMISRIDADVDKILALLAELGLERDTLVFFTGDNGPHAEDHHSHLFFNSSGPLRGHKRVIFEGGIRVPMIARWPREIEPGTVSDHVWTFWDILPTLAELVGVEPPQGIDGLSMLPALLGQEAPQHDFLYWELFSTFRDRFETAVRMGDWKGVRRGKRADIMLFNLREDIAEEEDVADDHPDIVAAIADIMEAEHEFSPDYPEMT